MGDRTEGYHEGAEAFYFTQIVTAQGFACCLTMASMADAPVDRS